MKIKNIFTRSAKMSPSLPQNTLTSLATYFFDGIIITTRNGTIKTINQPILDYVPGSMKSDWLNSSIFTYLHSSKIKQFYEHKLDMKNISLTIGTSQVLANLHFLETEEAILILKNTSTIQRLALEAIETKQQLKVVSEILDQLDEGICFIDIDDNILFYNKKQGELDSRVAKELEGKKLSKMFRQDSPYTKSLLYAKRHETEIIQNEIYFAANGKKYNVVRKHFPVFLGSKKMGAAVVTKDHTEIDEFIKTFYPQTTNQSLPDLDMASFSAPQVPFTNTQKLVKLNEQIQQLTTSSHNVVLFGESGTGKTLWALFAAYQFRDIPVITLDCALISPQTADDLLFGIPSQSGLIERASGGVLVLDNISSLALGLQEKLFRMLDIKSVIRNGTSQQIPVDIQLISTLPMKPVEAIRRQVLHESLFYVLGKAVLKVPSLTEQRGNLPDIFLNCVSQYSKSSLSHTLTDEARRMISAYSFPGNMRQLKHMAETMVETYPDVTIVTADHLPADLVQQDIVVEGASTFSSGEFSLVEVVENFEKQFIIKALDECSYHLTQTAEKLGISRQSLNYKLRKYELGNP